MTTCPPASSGSWGSVGKRETRKRMGSDSPVTSVTTKSWMTSSDRDRISDGQTYRKMSARESLERQCSAKIQQRQESADSTPQDSQESLSRHIQRRSVTERSIRLMTTTNEIFGVQKIAFSTLNVPLMRNYVSRNQATVQTRFRLIQQKRG